jgi:uncharacterized protein YcnI
MVRVGKYQRSNHNPHIEEEQTMDKRKSMVGVFLRVLNFPSPIKLTATTEILLKIAINTINQSKSHKSQWEQANQKTYIR